MRYILIKSGAINLAPFKIDLKIEFKFLLRLLASISAQSLFLGFLSAMIFCRDFNDFSKPSKIANFVGIVHLNQINFQQIQEFGGSTIKISSKYVEKVKINLYCNVPKIVDPVTLCVTDTA